MKIVLLLVSYCWFSSVSLLAADSGKFEQSFAVNVFIDANRHVRTIPRTLFGVNVENMWNANGVWNPWKQSLNEEILGLTKELGGTLYRYPGGTLGDFYHWMDGIGPRERRPRTQPITGEGDPQLNDFGTDEALDFAKRSGGHLLLSVNAGTGQAENAAAWVAHVRERAARDEDDSVTWWEVGNELYHKGDDKASSIGMTPEQYGEKFLAFARAMRKADPTIRIGAIGLENYGPYQFNSHHDWNEKVMRLTGAEMDFFAIHNAYAPVGPPQDADLRVVYHTLLGSPELIRANLHTVSNQIDKYAGPRGKKASIAITEWGPLFDVNPASPYILHTKTLGSALFTASTLMVFMETPRVEVATFFKLSDLNFMGLIGVQDGMSLAEYLKFEKGTFRPTACYLAFQLLATRFERELVFCQANGPTFDTRALGWTGAAKAVPYLHIAVSRSADGQRMTIVAINKHFDKSSRAAIKVDGMNILAQGRAWTLNGTGIDAHTGTGPVSIPGLQWATQAADKTNPRFAKGGTAEIAVTESPLNDLGHSFVYEFPAHSITIIELNARK